MAGNLDNGQIDSAKPGAWKRQAQPKSIRHFQRSI
jgi:hypothetical protein